MLAAVRCGSTYVLTEDSAAILADDEAIFVDSMEELEVELAIRHPTPEGFTNQEKVQYKSVYLFEGKLYGDRQGEIGKYGVINDDRNVCVKGEKITISQSLKAVTKDPALIEQVARKNPGTRIVADIKDHYWPEGWQRKQGSCSVFPIGDFLVTPDHYYDQVTLVFDPKKAKSIRSRRASAKKRSVKNGQPKMALLSALYHALENVIDEHPLVKSKSLCIAFGNVTNKANSRRGFYYQIPELAKISEALFQEWKENEAVVDALNNLMPYAEAMKDIKPMKVPSKNIVTDENGWERVTNKSTISKAENHNSSIDESKNFSAWLLEHAPVLAEVA